MKERKLYTLDDVMPHRGGFNTDSVRDRQRMSPKRYDKGLLHHAERAYLNLESWRKDIDRNDRFLKGDQWSDLTWTPEGVMTEKEYMELSGNAPIVVNMLWSLYSTITGLHAKQETEPQAYARGVKDRTLSDMMSCAIQANWQNTDMATLTDHGFGDLFKCGGVFTRESYEERDQLLESWTDLCPANSMFFEGGDDPRANNFSLIGQLHDMTGVSILATFGRPEYGLSHEELRRMFQMPADLHDTDSYVDYLEMNDYDNSNSFYHTNKPGRYRVIEVWSEEVKERVQLFDPLASTADSKFFRCEKEDLPYYVAENKRRKAQFEEAGVPRDQWALIEGAYISDKYWHYSFMTPDGFVLCEGESEYDFHSHPYTACFYPFINGEPVSALSLYTDIQKDINRMKALMDLALRTGVKGIEFLPLSLKPDDMTVEEYRMQSDLYGGKFVYDDTKPNRTSNKPEFYSHSAISTGLPEMLQISMNLLHEVSNINGAIQGKAPTAGTSGSSYAMQSQNATTSLYGMVKKYTAFKEKVAMKKCQLIQQYQEDGRDISVSSYEDVQTYDRDAVRDIRYRISIKDSAANPSYVGVIEEWMQGLVRDGIITAKDYLKRSNNPYAEKLLADVESREQAMLEGQQFQQPIQVPGADQQVAAQAQQAFSSPVQ